MSDTNCTPCSDASSSSGAPRIVTAGKYASVLDSLNAHEALKGKDNSILTHKNQGSRPVGWSDGSTADRISLLNLHGLADEHAKHIVALDSGGQLMKFFPNSSGNFIPVAQAGDIHWEPLGEANTWFDPGTVVEAEAQCQVSLAAFAGCDGNGHLQLVKLPSASCGYVQANGSVGEPNPAGVVQMFGGAFNQVPEGWLLCDGSLYSQSDYPSLFAAIGFSWGKEGSNFRVPDMRGVVPRGVDTEGTRDPEYQNRTSVHDGGNEANNVGSYQEDAYQCHEHVGGEITVTQSSTTVGTGGGKWITYVTAVTAAGQTGGNMESECEPPRTAKETRMKNVYMNFIISVGC